MPLDRNKPLAKILFFGFTLLMLIGLFYFAYNYFSSSDTMTQNVPQTTESEPYSTLICMNTGGKEALEAVRVAYDQSGDSEAFAVAEKYINSETCEYSTKDNLFWWQQGLAPEGFEEFEEVDCQELSNGHCVAVQPIYEYDEENEVVLAIGYMLIAPRVSSVKIPVSTITTRSQKGLILDLNY